MAVADDATYNYKLNDIIISCLPLKKDRLTKKKGFYNIHNLSMKLKNEIKYPCAELNLGFCLKR